ncbi:hypothetical protein DH2020_012477 [Rehmannia glutinosa]|uniref:Uncharacterized protein n=1 Tax=Rehmannia glutinosa TaxID=99300 RepID=A0ABR0X0T0_REHGL
MDVPFSNFSSSIDSEMATEFAEACALPTDSGIDASKNWKSCLRQRVFQDKKILMQEFELNNMIGYLKERKLFGTVTYARPYVERVAKEFYCNLLLDSFNPNSAKFGEAFLRKKVYHFTPQIVNDSLGTEDVIEDRQKITDGMVVHELTANHKIEWPELGKKLYTARYPPTMLCYTRLPLQIGFTKKETEKLIHIKSLVRIKPPLLKGERHVDLPLRSEGDIAETSTPPQVSHPILAYLIKQEKYAASQIEYWIHQRGELKRLISEQKGGVISSSKTVADEAGSSSDEEEGGNDAKNVANI